MFVSVAPAVLAHVVRSEGLGSGLQQAIEKLESEISVRESAMNSFSPYIVREDVAAEIADLACELDWLSELTNEEYERSLRPLTVREKKKIT